MASCMQNVPWKLYSSRVISAWGDRMWTFAVGLFMVELSPGLLIWPAIYGLTQALSVVIVGPIIGRWVDSSSRWNAARTSLCAQNLLVVACAVCVALTFYYRKILTSEADEWGLIGACSLIVIMGSLANLASVASSIVVYKDWIAIIADGDSEMLARMNSTCRSIDLSTNIIAPIAVGQIMYFVSHIVAAITIAAWNILSFLIEFLLLWRIYTEFPKLSLKQDVKSVESNQPTVRGEPAEMAAPVEKPKGSKCVYFTKRFRGFFKGWRVYFNHDVRNAGIGLACLYMTVLGFDSITSGYAYSQGVPESLLGILMGFGAIVGLLGSVAFPFFVQCLGVVRTGLYGFGLEVACLSLCVASVWAPGSPFDPNGPFTTANSTESSDVPPDTRPESYTSVILLMSGIIAARFGLWVADLSVNQVLQEVDDGIRGTINGVQSSVNMIFDTVKFLLVIACPWPETFGILICISFAAICSGWGFYASYSFKKRGHLLPFHKLVTISPPEQAHEIKTNDKKNDLPVEIENVSIALAS